MGVGGAVARGVGSMLVSGALQLGVNSVYSTGSAMVDATSQIVGFAGNHVATPVVAGVLSAANVPAPAVAAVTTTAGLAGSAALGTARMTATTSLGAAQQVGVLAAGQIGAAVTAPGTTSAISSAGQQALSSTSSAAQNTW